jgi:hypothetical protein
MNKDTTRAILAYLGVPHGPPSLARLRALVNAYTRRVPWESASRITRRAAIANPSACPRWAEEFWGQAIAWGIGGTCFESNYAFFALLRSLGYSGYLTINDMAEQRGCHTAIVLSLEGGRWLADVGYPLYAPLSLDGDLPAVTHTPYHTYTLAASGERRYTLERDRHPRPYAFTLIDEPVNETVYRAATTADYGEGGLFLDQVIITKVIGEHAWRFYSAQKPLHLEEYVDGVRIDHPLPDDPVQAVAQHFDMEEAVLATALGQTL